MQYNKLTWVIQTKAIGQDDFDALAQCVAQLGCRVEYQQVVPFSHEPATVPPAITGLCVVYGSSGLLELARNMGWSPAGWDGDSFCAGKASIELGSLALNHAGVTAPLSQAGAVAQERQWKSIFIRPDSETKEFAGHVCTISELEIWISQLRDAGYLKANDCRALISEALDIRREWRAFIVSGEVVSLCQYADAGMPRRSRSVPPEVLDFVTLVLSIYQPAPCFVVDVAEVWTRGGLELRVVEYNSINSAGFYACGICDIAGAISRYVLLRN
jgi:hypothetical protein